MIQTNTIGYNAPGFVEGQKLSFPGTRHTTIAKQFKKRLRDKSLLPEITTNGDMYFEKGSTEAVMPVLPMRLPVPIMQVWHNRSLRLSSILSIHNKANPLLDKCINC